MKQGDKEEDEIVIKNEDSIPEWVINIDVMLDEVEEVTIED